MSDAKLDTKSLTDLNDAVQNYTYQSVEFAQAVREWIAAATERMEPASEGAKVECPNCLQKVPGELEHWHSGYHDDNYTVEPHYVCEQQISELDDRHNRMASLEAQAKFRAAMDRRAVEIGVDRLVGISAFPVGNCPTCGDLVAPWNKHAKYEGGYTCKPAQPEPAAPVEMPFLRDELSRLLNHHSRENHSNTPDFVLAGFLMDALCAWERATGERDTFFGQNPRFAAMVNGPERKQPEPTAPRPLSYPIATDAEEPAASSEMPEAVRNAWKALRKEHYETFALALESWWRAHSQPAPAPVRMTEEMERLIQFAENNIENRCGEIRHEMPKVIAAVRAQAAEGVKLPKVRALLESRPRNYPNLEYDAALAELDAAEWKVAG